METALNETDELEEAARAIERRRQENKKEEPVKIDEKEEEKKHIRNLLGEPEYFYCPTVYRRIFGFRVDKWKIYPQPLTVLIRSNRQTLDYKVESEEQSISATRVSMVNNGLLIARFLAIIVAGNGLFYKQKTWFYTRYFVRRMTPQAMFEAIKLSTKESDYTNFLLSIGWTQSQRLTQPVPIEADKEG